jgi:hypothetical protein
MRKITVKCDSILKKYIMKSTTLLIACVSFLLFSCNSKKISNETYSGFQKKGSEISNKVQSVLLANVAQAMQTGGPVYAVEFCNLQASAIIDSLNLINNCVISRVSEKNRNPANNLKTSAEKNLWEKFESGNVSDTIIQEQSKLVFYKPIKTGLPACLKCHGQPRTDIDNETFEKIQHLYPNDLATGYKLNDFRGLWKIEFTVD